MSDQFPTQQTADGEGLILGIACARFNQDLTSALLQRVETVLKQAGAHCEILWVPGSLELPFAMQSLSAKGGFHALIALGVVIAGDTQHHEHIAYATSYGLQKVALENRIPVINGIMVTDNREQAEARTLGEIDKGAHYAMAALEMGRFAGEIKNT